MIGGALRVAAHSIPGYAGGGKQLFHHALDGQIIPLGAVGGQDELLCFRRQQVRGGFSLGGELFAQGRVIVEVVVGHLVAEGAGGVFGGLLEHRALGRAGAPVAAHHFQNAGQGGGAHDGGILAQGVGKHHGAAQGIVFRQMDRVEAFGAAEAEGLALPQAVARQGGGELFVEILPGGGAGLGHAPHDGAGDLVVAHIAGDLLGDVAVALHVPAVGGADEHVALQLKAQRQQDAGHLAAAEPDAQQAVDGLGAQGEAALFAGGGVYVHNAVHHVARVQQLHQLQRAGQGPAAGVGVQALFIAGAGLGAQAQLFGGGAHAGAVEHGALEHHRGGVPVGAAVLAAHDAGHADGARVVGNDEHFRAEGAVGTVQRDDALALAGAAHPDVAAVHVLIIEAMHGLAVFQHDVVGDVDQVVDGAHAAVAKALAHPPGAGPHPHVFHHGAAVAVAQVGVFHIHG